MAGPTDAASQGLQHGLHACILWPAGKYIARRGRADSERALAALHAITQRFTAEFAIRPLIVQHPVLFFTTLQRWTADPSAHVRRLVSEGSRTRLPWGLRLQSLLGDPNPTLSLPLPLPLQEDPSDCVRRSVANHLNDIAKNQPALVATGVQEHLPDAPAARGALLKHASRTLVKQGHAPPLHAWGLALGFTAAAALQARRPARRPRAGERARSCGRPLHAVERQLIRRARAGSCRVMSAEVTSAAALV